MHQRIWHWDILCKTYEESKVFLGRGSKNCFFNIGTIHIDFGDVHKVMMADLGRLQFWVYPPYMTHALICRNAMQEPINQS